jgi:hypothetical protein
MPWLAFSGLPHTALLAAMRLWSCHHLPCWGCDSCHRSRRLRRLAPCSQYPINSLHLNKTVRSAGAVSAPGPMYSAPVGRFESHPCDFSSFRHDDAVGNYAELGVQNASENLASRPDDAGSWGDGQLRLPGTTMATVPISHHHPPGSAGRFNAPAIRSGVEAVEAISLSIHI